MNRHTRHQRATCRTPAGAIRNPESLTRNNISAEPVRVYNSVHHSAITDIHYRIFYEVSHMQDGLKSR
jgi:hypothetical protein